MFFFFLFSFRYQFLAFILIFVYKEAVKFFFPPQKKEKWISADNNGINAEEKDDDEDAKKKLCLLLCLFFFVEIVITTISIKYPIRIPFCPLCPLIFPSPSLYANFSSSTLSQPLSAFNSIVRCIVFFSDEFTSKSGSTNFFFVFLEYRHQNSLPAEHLREAAS